MASPIIQVRQKWSSLSRRKQKLLRWLFWVTLVYTVIGFLVLPMIVRSVAAKRLSKELNREVTIQGVRFNPYAFSCSIRGLMIKDPDGEPFVSWDNVYVNFELVSFLVEPWVFKEFSATNIYVRAQMNKDYTFNFSDLIEKFSKPGAAPPKPSKPPALQIYELNVGGVRLSVTDLTPRTPFRRVIGPLEITLKNFYTDPNSKNPHAFTGSTDSGELFTWSGNFSLNPIRAEGELSVKNIILNKYAPLYQDLVRFEIRDGVASFSGGYKFVSSPTNTTILVTNASAALRSFKLGEPGVEENLIELQSFDVSRAYGDLIKRHVEVGGLSVTGAVMNLRRDRDASINFVQAASPAETSANMPGGIAFLLRSVTNAFAMFFNSTNQATGLLQDLSVDNCAVVLRDDVNSRPVRLRVDQINVSGKNLSNLPGTNLTTSVSLRWNTNGTIKIDLTASLLPLAVDLHLVLDQLELRPLDPYLEPFLNLFVTGSKLGMDGTVRMRGEPGQLPEVTFSGSYRLDDFATVDGVMAEDLVRWRSLRLEGIEANLNPPSITVDRVALDDAFARLAVETNGAINLAEALKPANTNQVVPESRPAAAAVKSLPDIKAIMTQTNMSLTSLVKITVNTVVISNAHLQLIDRSLTPNVQASMQQINGTITGISSDELRRAQVHVEGKLDNSGSIEITGQLNPLHHEAASQVKVVMKDIDLMPGDPYTGKFLGYRLRKGKLSVEVGYEITARQLKGQNLIRLDQLTLGEKVESPDATKLPVKLGIALLKDRSGKIELDVPVEGNLDDPQFRIGKVVWGAVINVFTKIVTSPFSVLGGLFGGKGEEISYQEFNPGSAELLPPAREKLDAMAKALYERPALEVEVEGHINPKGDLNGLRLAKLDQQLRARKWNTLRKSEQEVLSPQQIVLTPEERMRLLAELYEKTIGPGGAKSDGSKPAVQVLKVPDSMEKGAQILARAQLGEEQKQQLVSETERQLMETIPVNESDLRTLAVERAKQVQNYLVQSARVEAERIYLTQENQTGTATNGSRVYLKLQ